MTLMNQYYVLLKHDIYGGLSPVGFITVLGKEEQNSCVWNRV